MSPTDQWRSGLGEIDIVRRLGEWARAEPSDGLPHTAVPGTSKAERQALLRVGGIAAALGSEHLVAWPPDVRDWAERAPRPPASLVRDLRGALEGDPDILALLYEEVVSGPNRRRLGTFFTPPNVVEFMLGRAEAQTGEPRSVVDPGAGVGAFAILAARRWPKAQVISVDVNVVTLGLLAARAPDNVKLVHGDYLQWARTEERAPGARLWIGNPPYTRHHELTTNQKNEAIEAGGGLVKSRLAGLSAYFLAVTLNVMRPEDSLCFLLPANWTDARYGRSLRAWLSEESTRALECYGFDSNVDVFPGTRVAAMVIALGPSRSTSEQKPFSTASANLEPMGVVTSDLIKRDRSEIEQLGAWLWPRATEMPSGGSQLRTIGRVRRGVATGANRHFLLTDQARRALPANATKPILRRLRYVDGDRITTEVHRDLADRGERCWLVTLGDEVALDDPGIVSWMAAAEAADIRKRYLIRNRDPWYAVEATEPPDVIVSPMGKRKFRAVINDAGVLIANALYGIYLDGKSELAEPLVKWLNCPSGQAALAHRARVYGSRLLKLEPRDLGDVWVPKEVFDPLLALISSAAAARD